MIDASEMEWQKISYRLQLRINIVKLYNEIACLLLNSFRIFFVFLHSGDFIAILVVLFELRH